MSYRILQNLQEMDVTGIDDDDIEYLGKLIDTAADGFRTKYSKKSDWTHVLRAVKAIHTRYDIENRKSLKKQQHQQQQHHSWMMEKQVETSADIVIDQEDKPMVLTTL